MTRVCLTCETEYTGRMEIPVYGYCEQCGEKTFFGTEAEYEARQP